MEPTKAGRLSGACVAFEFLLDWAPVSMRNRVFLNPWQPRKHEPFEIETLRMGTRYEPPPTGSVRFRAGEPLLLDTHSRHQSGPS